MTTQSTTEIKASPFRSLGAYFAYDFQADGPREFKKSMTAIIKSGKFDRELMLTAAAELMVVGLPKVAKLVRAAANKCPSIGDIDAFWPYGERYLTAVRAAEASAERKLIRWQKQITGLLAKAGLGFDWVDSED
jgi:hypothetical protein